MHLLKLCFVIISSSIIFGWAMDIQNKLFDQKVLKIFRFCPCPRMNLPYEMHAQFGKANVRSVLITNITVKIYENLKDELKFTTLIKRCRSRENLDSCEDYYKIENLDYCQSISPDHTLPLLTNPLLIPLTPEFKCPIKQGIYHAYNFTFNLTPFLIFDMDGWYWKFKLELNSSKENNRPISCINVELYTKL